MTNDPLAASAITPFNLEELRARSKRWNVTTYDVERCIEEIDRLRAEIAFSRPTDAEQLAVLNYQLFVGASQRAERAEAEIRRLQSFSRAVKEPDQRYFDLRDAVTMWAGDGVISDDTVISLATEHATIAERCTCAISDDRTERGVPQLRMVPLLSIQRVEWAYPYGSEEPYVKISDLDKISRAEGAISSPQPKKCPTCDSPKPELHPSMQPDGGEVQLCKNPWHEPFTKAFGAISSPASQKNENDTPSFDAVPASTEDK